MQQVTELLWRELRERLRAFIARRVNPADVEDLLQEVFLRIHQHLPSVRDAQRLEPWIFQLTRNAITDYYRAASRRHEVLDSSPHDQNLNTEAAEVDSTSSGDETASLQEQLTPCLTPLIERLPERYREAIRLVELEGVPQRELSQRLAVSLSGAKSRVQRGRDKLKDLLLHCCQIELDKRGRPMDYRPERGRCKPTTATTTPDGIKANPTSCQCAPPKEEGHERPIM